MVKHLIRLRCPTCNRVIAVCADPKGWSWNGRRVNGHGSESSAATIRHQDAWPGLDPELIEIDEPIWTEGYVFRCPSGRCSGVYRFNPRTMEAAVARLRRAGGRDLTPGINL